MTQNDADLSPKMRANLTRLVDLIVGLNYSHDAAAEEMGISRSTVERWIANPTYSEMVEALVSSPPSRMLVYRAWRTLDEAMRSGRPHAVTAAREVLDRLDKPVTQQSMIEVVQSDRRRLTDAEFDEAMALMSEEDLDKPSETFPHLTHRQLRYMLGEDDG